MNYVLYWAGIAGGQLKNIKKGREYNGYRYSLEWSLWNQA